MMYCPKRVFCLGLSVLVSVYLGFFAFGETTAADFIGQWGYWFLLAAWILLCVHLLKWIHQWFPGVPSIQSRMQMAVRKPAHWFAVLYVLIAWFLMIQSQPWEYKIVMDEPVLTSTSLQMHLEKEAFCYLGGYEVEGVYYPYLGGVDKRPLFFPFLMSLLHDFLGYDPYQGVYLNVGLALVFLILVYRMGRSLVSPYGGYLAVGLLVTSPLLAMNATSGGFDLLNLLMILCVAWAGYLYLRNRDGLHLNLLVLAAVLLAQTRYESALYVLPVVLCILLVWWQTRTVQITKTLICVPLLMLMVPLQQLVMQADERYWQMRDQSDVPFALEYVVENWSHAMRFFLSVSDRFPNSVLITLLFMFALVAGGIAVVKGRWRKDLTPPNLLLFAGFGTVVLGNLCLLMAYHWGQVDDLAATRLVLPFILLQVVGILFGVRSLIQRTWVQVGLVSITVIFFWSYTLPLSARTNFLPWSVEGMQVDYLVELSESEVLSDSLIIASLNLSNRIGLQSCVDVELAMKHADRLRMHQHLKFFKEMYVVYLVPTELADLESSRTIQEMNVLRHRIEASFDLELAEARKLNDAVYLHLSRVLEVYTHGDASENTFRGVHSSVTNVGKVELSEGAIERFMESLPQ